MAPKNVGQLSALENRSKPSWACSIGAFLNLRMHVPRPSMPLRGPPYSESFDAKLYVETRMLAQTPAQHDSAGPAGFHHAEEGTIQIEHEDVIIACTLGGAVGMRRST